ncbi:amino acid adenylation domain-containing protein [Streptomyces sp.]|uniref:amino acid adenylation domain-containing protein n=1 Tax=Streptomyces sp. TaxID=1931 RepID=UPI002D5F0EDA|nr:amino acid adenylation domain-containing protein [Streptomyces sp.]HZF89581.1 amino acid adenylation domain-containing protein [Streptomyces sp.]
MNPPRSNPPTRRLDQVLADAAGRHGDRLAVIDETESLTYRQLDERVTALARELTRHGVGPGSRVGVHAPRGITAVTALYAVLRAGAVAAPLDPADPPARLARTVRGSGLHFLASAAPARAAEAAALLGRTAPPTDLGGLSLLPVAAETAGDLALDGGYIFSTSGSTGTPKGVLLSHENVLHFADWAARTLGLRAEDRVGAQAALTFDLSTFDLYSSALAGAAVHLMPERLTAFPADVAGWLREHEISVLYAVPTLYRLLRRTGLLTGRTAPHLRLFAFAGEPLPPDLLAWYLAGFPGASCHNLYGPTETNVCTAAHFPPGSTVGDTVPIGRAVEGVHTVVLDPHGRPARRGELHVAGPTVLRGYLVDGELRDPTREVRFADGVTRRAYPTGDLAETGDDGRLLLLGRADDQVKRRGHRIDLRDVESALREAAAPEACAVVAKRGPHEGEIWAYVVGAESERQVLTALAGVLPRRMLPDRIVLTDRLPVSGHGKVDRRELAELASTEGA